MAKTHQSLDALPLISQLDITKSHKASNKLPPIITRYPRSNKHVTFNAYVEEKSHEIDEGKRLIPLKVAKALRAQKKASMKAPENSNNCNLNNTNCPKHYGIGTVQPKEIQSINTFPQSNAITVHFLLTASPTLTP